MIVRVVGRDRAHDRAALRHGRQDFLPQDDQSEFEVSHPRRRTATRWRRRARVLGEIEERLRGAARRDRRADHDRRPDRPRDAPARATSRPASIYVRLIDLRERDFSQFDVMDDARAHPRASTPTCAPACRASTRSPRGGSRIAERRASTCAGPTSRACRSYADRLMAGMRAAARARRRRHDALGAQARAAAR